ncbi:MAG: GC-type dockerin domain-anchored protein [Planctomycetota bacterium]
MRLLRTATMMTIAAGTTLTAPASITFSVSDTTVAQGEIIAVSMSTSFDTSAFGDGLFAPAGLWGFGGTISSSDPGNVSSSSVLPNALLTLGPVAEANGAQLVRAAAGRSLMDGGLPMSPVTLLTFDLTISPDAPDGPITLTYDGAVVLSTGDRLVTLATSPGPGQITLDAIALELTVSSSTCEPDITTDGANPGDPGFLMPDGQVTVADLSTFVEQWLVQNLAVTDITTDGTNPGDPSFLVPDGQVTVADLSAFVELWLAGCP